MTSIGKYAFYQCSSLSSIEIPSGVTSIGYGAFSGCGRLTDVYYDGNEEAWNAILIGAYNDALTNATIHYNSTGSDDNDSSTYGGPFSIKVFVEWNDETNTAVFDSGITYQTDEDTDMSFVDNLDELIDQKVLVVVEKITISWHIERNLSGRSS